MLHFNPIGRVMVDVLVSNAVDHGFAGSIPDRVKTKTMKFVFVVRSNKENDQRLKGSESP